MGDARYRSIRSNLVEALQHCPIVTQMEEINDLDSILRYPIAAVPAIMVEDKVIFESGEIPTAAQLETLLREAFALFVS